MSTYAFLVSLKSMQSHAHTIGQLASNSGYDTPFHHNALFHGKPGAARALALLGDSYTCW
jgi:hypothetical protein